MSACSALESLLKARRQVDAERFVQLHFRPIHILVTEASSSGQILAATLKLYRREAQVLFVALQARALQTKATSR